MTKKVELKKRSWILGLIIIFFIIGGAFYWSKLSQTKISEDVFMNATYSLNLVGDQRINPTKVVMTNGIANIGPYGACFIINVNTKEVLSAAIDQNKKVGVVEVNCNYGASLTDVFLVVFKNLNSSPVQTDVVDLRNHPDLQSHVLTKVSMNNLSFDINGNLKVDTLVVPDTLKDASGVDQYATEPVAVNYRLTSDNKLEEQTNEIVNISDNNYEGDKLEYDLDNNGKKEIIFQQNTDTANGVRLILASDSGRVLFSTLIRAGKLEIKDNDVYHTSSIQNQETVTKIYWDGNNWMSESDNKLKEQ